MPIETTTKGVRHGKPGCSLGTVIEGSGQSGGLYEKVFDWKIQHIPEMNYRFVETGGQGGITRHYTAAAPRAVARQHAFYYIDVEDLADYRQRIVAAGGKILMRSRMWLAWARSRSSPIPRGA